MKKLYLSFLACVLILGGKFTPHSPTPGRVLENLSISLPAHLLSTPPHHIPSSPIHKLSTTLAVKYPDLRWGQPTSPTTPATKARVPRPRWHSTDPLLPNTSSTSQYPFRHHNSLSSRLLKRLQVSGWSSLLSQFRRAAKARVLQLFSLSFRSSPSRFLFNLSRPSPCSPDSRSIFASNFGS